MVRSVAFSADGKRIVSGSMDKTLRLWDSETGQQRRSLKGHLHFVTSVDFSPNGQRIVSGSYDRTLRVWDVERSGPNIGGESSAEAETKR